MRRKHPAPSFGHFMKPSALRHALRIDRDKSAQDAHAKAWRSDRDGKFRVPHTKAQKGE